MPSKTSVKIARSFCGNVKTLQLSGDVQVNVDERLSTTPSVRDERCIGGCGRHGQCNETAKECMCDNGFAGEKCEKEACPNQCSKHGMCEKKSGDCICHQDWQGYDCSTPRCTKNCRVHLTIYILCKKTNLNLTIISC